MQIEVNRNQNTYNKSINHRDLHNHPGDDEETDPPGGYGETPHPETNGDHEQNSISNTHHDDGPHILEKTKKMKDSAINYSHSMKTLSG